ncbi:IS5 family transposase [Limibacterium fermenti]|uniref:IS5 family transposase n=1 Tax=Limibacterium fermenti TaxID=3229863 RepID=UPI003A79ACE0
MINTTPSSRSLFSSLDDLLNQQHPLHKLSGKINWAVFETAFTPLYCSDNGRPAKPIRLMCGLLILKHLRNISDESVVEQWSENAYFQYFCGMHEFMPSFPCNASELVHFRRRIGEKGIELILAESIRVNDDKSDEDHHRTVFIDSTVQEKNVTYPTDAKLHKKIVGKVLKIVKELNLPLRQSYTFILKGIYRDLRFRNHPKNRKKALKADKRLRTITGRLVRELKRNLGENRAYDELLSIFEKILLQRRNSPHKIYSIHEPDVQCISKGKEHKKYEFGNKVSIIRSATGVILGASSFRNEYDGHTIQKSLEQVFRLTGKSIKRLAGDRGYRGKKEINGTQILIPDTPKAKDTSYQRKKKHQLFCKRAGIEPTIGHLKTDHRLGRNFYKGILGDAINVLLAAAAYNFKRAMRVLLGLIRKLLLEGEKQKIRGVRQMIPIGFSE